MPTIKFHIRRPGANGDEFWDGSDWTSDSNSRVLYDSEGEACDMLPSNTDASVRRSVVND